MLEKISDNVYADVSGEPIGNVGVIRTRTGSYAIDTSMFPPYAKKMREFMESKLGGAIGAILTHYHADHSWGAQEFSDLELIGHEFCVENMRNAAKERWSEEAIKSMMVARPRYKELLASFKVTFPNKSFKEKEMLVAEDEIRLIHVGGHTSGSTLVYFEKESILFAGDILFANEYPWGGDMTADPYLWVDALETIIELKPQIIIPGHGPVQKSLDEIKNHKMYFEALIQTGERLYCQKGIDDQAIAIMAKIGFHKEKSQERKIPTIQQFYKIIKRLAKEKTA